MEIEISVNDRKYTAKCEYIKNFVPNYYSISHWRIYTEVNGEVLEVFEDDLQRGVEYLAYKIADCQN